MPRTSLPCCLLLILGPLHAARAQHDPPALRANSPLIDIQDGPRFWKGTWSADPTLERDTYDAGRSDKPRTITFISDIDKLSIDVEPGRFYDFVVLLNGKDACPTRISTMLQPGRREPSGDAHGPDTIPISISRGKLHLTGRINDSQALDLIFDTGADTNVLYPSGVSKGAVLHFDGATNNAGTGGVTRRQTSSDNRLSIANLRWDHEPVMFIEKQADAADGIVGYRVFEDRVLEFDYDRMLLIVHEALPAEAASYSPTPLAFVGTLTAVEATLINGGTSDRGLFALDTGGTGPMIINQAFATEHNLHNTLKKVGSSRSQGVGSATIQNSVLLVPQLVIAGHVLENVAVDVELPSDGNKAPPGGVLCMEVLQRFNTILDYPKNQAYFKPNSLFAAPFNPRRSGLSGSTIAIATAVGTALAVAVFGRARSRQRAESTH